MARPEAAMRREVGDRRDRRRGGSTPGGGAVGERQPVDRQDRRAPLRQLLEQLAGDDAGAAGHQHALAGEACAIDRHVAGRHRGAQPAEGVDDPHAPRGHRRGDVPSSGHRRPPRHIVEPSARWRLPASRRRDRSPDRAGRTGPTRSQPGASRCSGGTVSTTSAGQPTRASSQTVVPPEVMARSAHVRRSIIRRTSRSMRRRGPEAGRRAAEADGASRVGGADDRNRTSRRSPKRSPGGRRRASDRAARSCRSGPPRRT